MISKEILLMTVLCVFINYVRATTMAMGSSRAASSSKANVSMNMSRAASSGSAGISGNGASTGVTNGLGETAGGENGQKKASAPANGELNMVQNAIADYEQQIGVKSGRKKTITTDANGNKVICETIPGGGNGGNGVEGATPQDSLARKKEKCIIEAIKKKQLADSVIKQAESAKECTIKVNKRSMICHTKKVIQDMIENPIYELKQNGNVVTVLEKGEAILATVVETMNYNVIREKPVKSEKLQQPNVDLKFNKLGGLLSQEGEMPSAKTENPCAVCMQQLTNKANTMEGGVDDCNYSCDSNMLTSFLKPSHFKEIKPEDGVKSTESEKVGEEGGAGGEEVAH